MGKWGVVAYSVQMLVALSHYQSHIYHKPKSDTLGRDTPHLCFCHDLIRCPSNLKDGTNCCLLPTYKRESIDLE